MSAVPTPRNKRPAIIEAALKLFAERGFEGTTTRDIAASAGITEGAIYRHFPSKEALATGLFVDCMGRLLSHLQAASADGETPADRLCSVVRAFLAFAAAEPVAYRYIMASHESSLPTVKAQKVKPKDVFAQIIADGMAAGQFRAMDPQLATAMVVGMCIRTVFFINGGMLDSAGEDVTGELCEAALRVLATT